MMYLDAMRLGILCRFGLVAGRRVDGRGGLVSLRVRLKNFNIDSHPKARKWETRPEGKALSIPVQTWALHEHHLQQASEPGLICMQHWRNRIRYPDRYHRPQVSVLNLMSHHFGT